ncbi:MAG: transposase [Lachnospiraceae bacterium]|nr:transposase [Lachnospiraceae bacterium]
MNTISQSEMLIQDATNEVGSFLRKYRVSDILKQCNGYKQKGFSVIQLFAYLVTLMFQPLSTYMSMRVGAYKEPFSKNTIRRFCNNASINWHKFLRIISQKLVVEFMRPATSDEREEFFIIDDTPFRKSGKKTELVSKFFNHVNMKFEMGYRILTLLWTDGYSNVPVDFTPLSSGNEKLIVSKAKEYDGRTLAGRIRKQACMKAPELILMMLSQAVTAGHTAKYVLFDSWFATPKGIMDIKNRLHMDVIAMVKKSSKVFYEYNGKQYDVKEIFSRCKKRRGRSKYLLSVDINLLQKKNSKILDRMPAKLVYVRNKVNKKDWIAIVCTDTTLSEKEIIKRYGYRWNIEIYFKTCKQYLKYTRECQSTSFDSLTTHLAIANVRYMMLSVFQRANTDHRSLGELFYLYVQEVAEITFDHSMKLIIITLLSTVKDAFSLTDVQMADFVQQFINNLPDYLKAPLKDCAEQLSVA